MNSTADNPEKAKGRTFVGLLVSAAALALLTINAIWLGANCGKMRAPRRGDVAPAFSLRDLSGASHDLASLRGKVVLLDFWATWCPPCVAKYPALEALADAHGSLGLEVLAISVDRDQGQLRSFIERRASLRRKAGKGPSKIKVLRSSGAVSAAYGVHTLPHVVLVDRQGRLRHVSIGRGGQKALEAELQRALADR